MLKSKSELEKYLVNRCEVIVFQQETCRKIQKYLLENFKIPIGMTMDMIAQRIILSEQSEFMLFCLLKGIKEVKKGKDNLEDYFTEIEIKQYSKSVYYP